MKIEARDEQRRRIGRLVIDPAQRPTRASTEDGAVEVFLEWEAGVDDAGRLRKCLCCGCPEMYRKRMFPQVTGFLVVLAFAGALVGIFGRGGFAKNPVVLGALVLVLVLDVASLVFRKYRLVCYRCRSVYSDIDIARQHRAWDRLVAEKYPTPGSEADVVETPGPQRVDELDHVDALG